MSDTVLKVENVSVKYRLTEQKVDDLKDYLTSTLHIWDEPDIAQPINRNDFNAITNAWYNESIII